MDFVQDLCGAAPVIKRYQANESFSNAGIVVLAPGNGTAGVQISTTTSFANAVGVTLNEVTYVTAQQTDGTSAERLAEVIVNPFAVYEALMNGGATEGTDLTEYSITTASTDGLSVISTDISDWTCPAFEDGVVWFKTGLSAGQARKVTSGSSSDATITVAFDGDLAVGDVFYRAPYWPFGDVGKAVQTTTNLYQADASIAAGTGGAARIIDLVLNGAGDSKVRFCLNDMVITQTT